MKNLVMENLSYDFFLFCKLSDIINPHDTEYDIEFEERKAEYAEFLDSDYNDLEAGLYDCIHEYLHRND